MPVFKPDCSCIGAGRYKNAMEVTDNLKVPFDAKRRYRIRYGLRKLVLEGVLGYEAEKELLQAIGGIPSSRQAELYLLRINHEELLLGYCFLGSRGYRFCNLSRFAVEVHRYYAMLSFYYC